VALSPRQVELQVITKYRKVQVSLLKNGARIEHICADTISNLILSASADRFHLAQEFFASAQRMFRSRPPMQRNVISRSYYGMYHAARAVAYLHHEGDDHESHNDLHKGLPGDFPDVDLWKNALKDARLRRNEADYDPYPPDDSAFRLHGQSQIIIADKFIGEAEAYLRARGCPI
jgi:uncharacterized protein (UPF0332 family)